MDIGILMELFYLLQRINIGDFFQIYFPSLNTTLYTVVTTELIMG